MKLSNVFSSIPPSLPDELFDEIIKTKAFTLERIVSEGQSTPEGQWYDQDRSEWVILLTGKAGLRFEGEEDILVMQPGDYVLIAPHRRHRVEWTDRGCKTVWLALHF
jgi:cupin 2 domain-containing protein